MAFLDEQYLLESETAKRIYDQIKDLPIFDVHSHVSPKRIAENEGWNDIWEVEGETDHYVWSLMRKRGVPEEKITGDASNREKWRALAEIFPRLAGNPTYEWIHLDLKRRFGIDEPISGDTCEEIWEETSEKLEEDEMRPQELLDEMGVEVLCSTDDPTSELRYHQRAEEELKKTDLLSTWRPDRAMKIGKDSWEEFRRELEQRTDISTSDFDGFLEALWKTHDYFDKRGCAASDLAMRKPISKSVEKNEASRIYEEAVSGSSPSDQEKLKFKAFLLEKFGEMNEETGWVTQLHVGAVRDYRRKLFEEIGPDSGGDISTQNVDFAEGLKFFLNRFDNQLEVVLYCLDSTHLPTVATISRAFPNLSLGAPWWFNDSPYGIKRQLKYGGTVGLLSNFAGMVSDSRKLISFGSRFEVFRRVLADVIGELVEKGQIPEDVGVELAGLVSWRRPKKLFGF